MKKVRLLSAIALTTVFLLGCSGPIALSKALPDYDETASQLQGQSLLLNIARGRHYMPPHFTYINSIVATFDFETRASIGASFPSGDFGNPGATLGAGTTLSENPTIELVPLRGEDFARQLLTPLSDNDFALLVTEGLPLDMLIRLMGKSFHFQAANGGLERVVRNRPAIPEEYEEFRRIALHLAALNERALLFARQLSFVHSDTIKLPSPPSASEWLDARQNGIVFIPVGGNEYQLDRQIIGNTLVSNFDIATRSNAELEFLNAQISLTPSNYVDIDIRADNPGGEYPLRGALQLRNFTEILDFVASGMEDAPEYNVSADIRTVNIAGDYSSSGSWQQNPARVLAILESELAPASSILQVNYRDTYYSVQQDQWNLTTFKTLYMLLQISSQASPQRAFPITISK
jgi:hypothetical protein